MSKKNGKKSSGTSGATSGTDLVAQDHGGALLKGGVVGHKGAGGAQPSAIREACRKSFGERLSMLETIIDNKEARDLDRIAAMSALGKYGGVDKLALTVDEQPEEADTPERAARLWMMLKQIKSVHALEKLLVGADKKQAEG